MMCRVTRQQVNKAAVSLQNCFSNDDNSKTDERNDKKTN